VFLIYSQKENKPKKEGNWETYTNVACNPDEAKKCGMNPEKIYAMKSPNINIICRQLN